MWHFNTTHMLALVLATGIREKFPSEVFGEQVSGVCGLSHEIFGTHWSCSNEGEQRRPLDHGTGREIDARCRGSECRVRGRVVNSHHRRTGTRGKAVA